jgi:hypothetical protein
LIGRPTSTARKLKEKEGKEDQEKEGKRKEKGQSKSLTLAS